MPHFHIKMHICCFTLREQNHVYLPVRGALWPYKIQQIRLRPGLRPRPGKLTTLPRPPSRLGRGTPPDTLPRPHRSSRLRSFVQWLILLKNALVDYGPTCSKPRWPMYMVESAPSNSCMVRRVIAHFALLRIIRAKHNMVGLDSGTKQSKFCKHFDTKFEILYFSHLVDSDSQPPSLH